MFEAWHFWVMVGLAALVIELFVPGFVFGCLGFACFATSLASFLGAGIEIQIVSFAVAGVLAFVSLRPLYFLFFGRDDEKKRTNVDALAGKQGLVVEDISLVGDTGRVKLGGEDWRAVLENDAPVGKGSRVEVVRVEGAKLVVRQIPETGENEQ